MKRRVTKAVIPAAGLGTRFLPATKSVPKELLPIVDTPTIQVVVKELVDSGIDTVVLITGKGKAAIEDHFDVSFELEKKLEHEGKKDLAHTLRDTSYMARIVSVRQGEPKGLGHAVLCAKDIIGYEPFLVLLGDDLVDAPVPCSKQMLNIYDEYQRSVVALSAVEKPSLSDFGVCAGKEIKKSVYELDTMVEKPEPGKAPSNLAIVGRYILNPRIFTILEETQPGNAGEIQLTDAMATLMNEEGFIGYEFDGDRYDAGDKLGFLKANMSFGLKRDELREDLLAHMEYLLNKYRG